MQILNYIKYPWTLPSLTFNAKLNCEIKFISEKIDLQKIKNEATKIINDENFLKHKGDHSGGWGAIGLITFGGNPQNDLVTKEEIKPTRLLPKCPEVQKILNLLPGTKQRVRFMEVTPGTRVFWHYDNGETIDNLDFTKNARLHVPIFTNEDVQMNICHEQIKWEEGKMYYGDFSFPHMIHNRSTKNRIHLVIDLKLTEEFLSLVPNYFMRIRKKRLFIKRLCQRSLNLYKKLNFVEND
jgi:aspartyl/asparaginyl beta-hydroxylase (cupin superfamily)